MRHHMGAILLVGGLLFGALGGFFLYRGVSRPSQVLSPFELKAIEAGEMNAVSIAKGKDLFGRHCQSCHEARPPQDGEEALNIRDYHNLFRPDFYYMDFRGLSWQHSFRDLFYMILFGGGLIKGDLVASDMPAFAGVLEAQEVRLILVYLLSTWVPQQFSYHQSLSNLPFGQFEQLIDRKEDNDAPITEPVLNQPPVAEVEEAPPETPIPFKMVGPSAAETR